MDELFRVRNLDGQEKLLGDARYLQQAQRLAIAVHDVNDRVKEGAR